LYIPHIADHPHGSNIDTHDLALQIVDIVTLRPEIELCYMGLGQKCFEILENRPSPGGNRNSMSSDDSRSGRLSGRARGYDDDESSERDSEAEATDSDDGQDTSDGSDGFDADGTDTTDSEDDDVFQEEHEDDVDSASDSDWEPVDSRAKGMKLAMKLRLQEILFYDKIAIFKARHGRL
jgi:hypothetical protein